MSPHCSSATPSLPVSFIIRWLQCFCFFPPRSARPEGRDHEQTGDERTGRKEGGRREKEEATAVEQSVLRRGDSEGK